MMTLELHDMTEKEAAAAARKAVRERRKAEKEAEANYAQAKNYANANAVSIFTLFHRNECPQSWEKLTPEAAACVSFDNDIPSLHAAHGSAPYKPHGVSISHVFECNSGALAISLYVHHDGNLIFAAVGVCGDQIALVTLPEAVGAWLNHAADRNN